MKVQRPSDLRSSEAESTPFDLFQELIRKLTQVPKEEVDKLAKEEQAKKPDDSKEKAA